MFPKERRKEIVSIVNATGFATVEDLAKRFGVSVDSIRKDLKTLQKEGKIQREYGGALKIGGEASEQAPHAPVAESVARQKSSEEEGRKNVALRAYMEINDGDAIFLGVSRTNVYLADIIAKGDKHLVVTTNMIEVMPRLAGNPKVTTLATGGYLNVQLNGFTGPAAISMLEPLLFSKAFVGTCGVDLETSAVLADSVDDGRVNERVLQNASYCFLLADEMKFSQHKGYRFASVSDFAAVITDSCDRELQRRIASTGVPVLC